MTSRSESPLSTSDGGDSDDESEEIVVDDEPPEPAVPAAGAKKQLSFSITKILEQPPKQERVDLKRELFLNFANVAAASAAAAEQSSSLLSPTTLMKLGASPPNPNALSPIWISELHRRFFPDRMQGRRIGHPYQARAPPKHKKPRTSFTKSQIAELEKRFLEQKYLASTERATLAKALQMTDSQVKTWFQNRRTKWRRQAAEEREQERQQTCKYLASAFGSAETLLTPSPAYCRPDVTI